MTAVEWQIDRVREGFIVSAYKKRVQYGRMLDEARCSLVSKLLTTVEQKENWWGSLT